MANKSSEVSSMNSALSTDRDQVLSSIRQKKLKLGFAESCTGGKLSAAVVDVPGVSDIYMGSVVSYSYEAKKMILGVQQNSLEKFGAVSEQVVREMAEGAKKVLNCDVVVAVSGIAGPGGGTVDKPVGTVCFAFAGPHFLKTKTQKFIGDRNAIQNQSVEFVFNFLKEQLVIG